MKSGLLLLTAVVLSLNAGAQAFRFSPGGDSSQSISLEAYADVYFGFDFNQPEDRTRPYSVSHSRHSETNLNLAYLSIKYTSERARVNFTPGFGTYMNANYATERATLQHIVEASIGVKPWKHKGIWIDMGVFPAPYTTEGPVAHDQLLYTRSLGAEYSPYYLTGIRATVPICSKVNLYLYLINGWQIIEDINAPLSFGSTIEWKPAEMLTINWSTYVGDERATSQPQYGSRYFSDLNLTCTPDKRYTFSADVYAGRQERTDSIDNKEQVNWYQGNVAVRRNLGHRQSIAARLEYFNDAHAVLVVPVTGLNRFDCGSFSLGYHVAVTGNVSFHAEGRYYISGDDVFLDDQNGPTNNAALLIGGLTAKF